MKVTAMKRRWCGPLKPWACIVVMLIAGTAYAQNADQKALEAIPEQLRPQLVEKLALYVEYQRTKEYNKLYDLLSRSTIHTVFQDQTKEEFVRAYQRGDTQHTTTRVIEFTPTATQKTVGDGPALYVIYGKARICQMGDLIKTGRVSITAQFEDGEWLFSTVAEVVID